MPTEMLTMGVPGTVYVLRVETDGVPQPKYVLDHLKSELKQKLNMEVLGLTVADGTMEVQVVGSLAFEWAVLLPLLPVILRVIGVAVTAVVAYVMLAQIPTWQWVLLIFALMLSVWGESLLKFVIGEEVRD